VGSGERKATSSDECLQAVANAHLASIYHHFVTTIKKAWKIQAAKPA